ncbi:MAG: argininosuccinate lyase [Pyramidobacter sp.]|nr:argininosuccinate lyase [Pyramidobacter sp.]
MKGMWKGRFHQDMNAKVLAFSQSLDLDWRLLPWDVQGSKVHAAQLARIGVLTEDEAQQLIAGLDQIASEYASGALKGKEALEDVHMNVEARLTEIVGPLGGKLHTGRSRNDQVALTMRLYLRDVVKELETGLKDLIDALLDRAKAHKDTVIPGYTHLQQAQPVSMGHYWMAHTQAFLKDLRRLRFAAESLDECPLGAGALAGSTLPLDREWTAQALGFSKPTENSMETVASRDHFLDILYFCSVFGVHCSRLSEDLIIYFTSEFGWLKLPDAFCTGSSIMPQKKNPDVLELTRGRAGGIIGHLVDLLVTLKGIPMTYDRDLQEDKRGLFAAIDSVQLILLVLPDLIRSVEVDGEKASAGFADGLALATDIAEMLVRKGLPFRDAHRRVGALVAVCVEKNIPLNQIDAALQTEYLPELADVDLRAELTARSAVVRRTTYGGTAFCEVERQIQTAEQQLKND